MRALIIEAEGSSTRLVVQRFKAQGMIVDEAGTGEEALELVRHYDYDVVLLETALPDMDGLDVVRRMRAAKIDTPVIVQSASMRPETRIKAFGVGADDVVAKPVDHAELAARVQAIVRRSKGYSQPTLRCGSLQLNLDSRAVEVSGQAVHLTAKEYAILELLVLRKGMVLTKEVFLNHLYGGLDEPEMKIIDVFICKLRKKLAEAGAPNVIGTVWGRGYTVREAASHPMLAPAAGSTSTVAVEQRLSA